MGYRFMIFSKIGAEVQAALTSHSVKCQLYNDGRVVQFPNLDILPGTHAMGS